MCELFRASSYMRLLFQRETRSVREKHPHVRLRQARILGRAGVSSAVLNPGLAD